MLEEFLQENGLQAQILRFEEEVAHCRQVEALERTLPVVKTIVWTYERKDSEGKARKGHVLAILEGRARVDKEKLAIACGADIQTLRLATREETLECTGYEIGGIPPVGIYGIPTRIDEDVLKHPWVIAGGGDNYSLLKIQSKELLEHAFEPKVCVLRKR